jgi:hypothetical protein
VDNGADLAVSGLRYRTQARVSIGEEDRPAKDEKQRSLRTLSSLTLPAQSASG